MTTPHPRAWTRLTRLILAIGLLGAFGCQQYNGAFGLNPQDKEAAVKYAQFKEDQAVQREQADLAARRQAGADFGDPTAPTPAGPPVPVATPVVHHSMADASLGRLGLYGAVPYASQRVPRSPLDGFEDIARVTTTVEGADFDPAMHPAGGLIAFASTRHRPTSDLYAQRVGSAAVTQLTNDPANDMMPAFSPDGSKLAFASDRDGDWNIYLMDARGGRPVQITTDATPDLHPSFSPDGKRLVYAAYNAQSQQWELVLTELDKPGSRQIIGQGLFPVWHPAGDTILYQRARQRGTRLFSIWSVDLTDGDPGSPTELASAANAACITPEWSADGRHVVFCTVIDPHAEETGRPSQGDVWVMQADGSQRTRLTGGRFANLQPIWSPDGAIYFVSNRGPNGLENVWAMRPHRSLQLAAELSGAADPALATDPAEEPKRNLGDALMEGVEAQQNATAEVPTTP
ncbi:MAG: DPP IV N-terminal domain-containing protein [Planctomycetota bacterium]